MDVGTWGMFGRRFFTSLLSRGFSVCVTIACDPVDLIINDFEPVQRPTPQGS